MLRELHIENVAVIERADLELGPGLNILTGETGAPSGKYRYAAPAADEFPGYDERLKKIFRECVTSYAEAQNIIVIKTLPGLASAACSALDSMRIDTLVGTLAGDDTAFLLMKDNTSADEFFHEIEKLL